MIERVQSEASQGMAKKTMDAVVVVPCERYLHVVV